MKLDSSQIAYKKKIGNDGICPVFRLVTQGGWNVIAAVRNGRAEEVAFGPHRGIAMFNAQKRCPNIRWSELSKSDMDAVDPHSPTVLEYQRLFDAYLAAKR